MPHHLCHMGGKNHQIVTQATPSLDGKLSLRLITRNLDSLRLMTFSKIVSGSPLRCATLPRLRRFSFSAPFVPNHWRFERTLVLICPTGVRKSSDSETRVSEMRAAVTRHIVILQEWWLSLSHRPLPNTQLLPVCSSTHPLVKVTRPSHALVYSLDDYLKTRRARRLCLPGVVMKQPCGGNVSRSGDDRVRK